jgi:hypothetical protein
MILSIRIECDNAAFKDGGGWQAELTRITKEVTGFVEHNGLALNDRRPLYDINGNRVGYAELTDFTVRRPVKI